MAELTTKTKYIAEFDQNILLIESERNHSTLLVYPGYDGDLDLHNDQPRKLTYNFFCRNRNAFAGLGFKVVIVDSPKSLKGNMLPDVGDWRRSQQAVDNFFQIKKKLELDEQPLWLAGTSRSPELILSIANQDLKACTGIILLSCLTKSYRGTTAISEVPIKNVLQPTLVVHHENDKCPLSEPQAIESFFSKIPSPHKKLVLVQSGFSVEGADPCKGNSIHGFWGADTEVINAIYGFTPLFEAE